MLPSLHYLIFYLGVVEQAMSWCLYKTTAGATNVTQIQYSPDRSMLLTTLSTGKVLMWDAPNMNVQTTITPASGSATDAKFSKNNTIFCIATSTSMVYVYNSTSPYSLLATITGGIGSGYVQIDTSYDGNLILICGGSSNLVKVYNISSSTFVSSFSYSNAYTCKFSPDLNKIIVAATTSSSLDYFQLAGTPIWTQSLNGCLDIDIDDAFTTIATSCNNGANRRAWVTDVAGPTSTNLHTSTGTMRTAKISGDGAYAAYSGDEKTLFIARNNAGTFSLDYRFPLSSQAYSSDFSSDSNYLIVGTKLGYIYQYSKFCIDCSSGQYQNLTTKKCELCSQFNRACGSCINSTYCYECNQGYYIQQISVPFTTTRGCLPCSIMEGCIVCNSSTVCIRCQVGYYVTGGACKACRNPMIGCLRCNSSTVCQQCNHDYYLNGAKTCTLCSTITGCSLCSSSSYCHLCQIGYYFSGGNCLACPTNCIACFNTTTCQDCRLGYYPTNTVAAACSPCPSTGCLSCNQTGYCLQCVKNRYYDTATGNCITCTFPCNQCYNGTVCVDCVPGYFLDYAALGYANALTGGVCTRCTFPCQTCNTTSYCLSCPIGYYLVSASHTCLTCSNLQTSCSQCTNTTCLNCTLGNYLNSSNLCTSCNTNMPGCLTCTTITNCLKCAPGLYLSGSGATSCSSCPQGCQVCNSTAYCIACIDGWYLDRGATQLCQRCVPPCTICTSASACLQCQEQYYLNGSVCRGCRENVTDCITCDDQTGVVKCTSCRVGFFVNNGACTMCTLPCLVCTAAASCSQCQIGYFISGTICTLCPQNCTACTSLTSCSSCSIGFYFNSVDSRCYQCSSISCLTCNSTQHCLSCSVGYYLTTAQACNLCASAIKYCQTCDSSTLCLSCSFGYILSAGNTSCTVCSTIQGCFDCNTTYNCQVCQNGYYLQYVSGNGTCAVCPYGCLTCVNGTYCSSCLPGYAFSGDVCTPCQNSLLGCSLCTSNSTCVQCSNGYYLTSTTCTLCRSTLKGCQYCNSSTVCTTCAYGYHIKTDNTCQICSITMQGCEVCVSGTVCRSCSNGYYLAANTCTLCVTALPGCLSCTDNNTCLQCIEGYAIQAVSVECRMCKTTMIGCIACTNLSLCDQCEAGYYLRTTDKQCVACTQNGCEVCPQASPTLCISCNTMYFLSSSRCYYCRDYMQGCIQCTASWTCTLCQTGYFLNSTNRCQLCQSTLQGCSKCNNSLTCYQCKSTYYLHTSLQCQTCLSAMDGCAYCTDLSVCISCANGYYKNTSTGFCQLCTNMDGCLACEDYGVCIVCRGEYFLDGNDTVCYPCGVLDGCYSCTDNITCMVCKGGYILNDDKLCEIYAVQADEPIKGMKMISEYISPQTLSHTLFAHQLTYNQSSHTLVQWQNSTDIILQYPTFVMQNLTIKEVKYLKSNQLLFLTNNPLNISLNSIVARRMLASMPEGYKTYLKMKQEMINNILPGLYISHSLVMDYDLNQPEFYTSIYTQKFNLFQSAIGIVLILIFTINYIVRAVVTCPGQALSQHGQILPHILAFKAPIFIVYPLFPEQISFCFGFMAPEFPWARQFFGNGLSDQAQTTPQQYSILYHSMSFASTYILPFVVAVGLIVAMWLYKKNGEKKRHEKKNIKDVTLHYEDTTKYAQQINWGLPEWPLKMVMYNFFYFGLVFNGCASLQNAIYNPIMEVNVSSAFTILGTLCYALALTDCLYSLYSNPLLFFKLRIFTKATLLSVCHISPIYLFSSAMALDTLNFIIQYRITKEYKPYPKLWIYNNIIINICLILLVFIHSHFVMLIFVGIFTLSVLIIELYVHYQDYHVDRNKKKFILPQEYKLDDKDNTQIGEGLNIWNISFDKNKDKSNHEIQAKKSENIKDMDEITKPNDSRAFRHERRSKKKKVKQNLKGLSLKEESMENIESFDHGDDDQPNTFVAADFIS